MIHGFWSGVLSDVASIIHSLGISLPTLPASTTPIVSISSDVLLSTTSTTVVLSDMSVLDLSNLLILLINFLVPLFPFLLAFMIIPVILSTVFKVVRFTTGDDSDTIDDTETNN